MEMQHHSDCGLDMITLQTQCRILQPPPEQYKERINSERRFPSEIEQRNTHGACWEEKNKLRDYKLKTPPPVLAA